MIIGSREKFYRKWVDSMKNRKGFTLIELLTVVAIIGILAAILIPSVAHFIQKARVKAAIADTRTIKVAIENALVDHLVNNPARSDAFNKILCYEQGKSFKNVQDLNKIDHEKVGCFTNYTWYEYKKNIHSGGKAQAIDYVIASAVDNAFTETWDSGNKALNPMKNSKTQTCEEYLKNVDVNFGLIVVYNRTGAVRLIQLYRKGILITYINGDYLANTSSDSHFVGSKTWDTIYADADDGGSAPAEMYKINLSGQQIKNNGEDIGGWFA